jgi:hypothetical protein
LFFTWVPKIFDSSEQFDILIKGAMLPKQNRIEEVFVMKLRSTLATLGLGLVLFAALGGGIANPSKAYAVEAVTIDEKHFPDSSFRYYVRENFDTDQNGELSPEEIDAVKRISCSGGETEITSLQGIRYFTELTQLECDYNRLKQLDLSENTKLTKLYCYSNNLTKLDISKNKKLEALEYDKKVKLTKGKNNKSTLRETAM